LRPWARRSGLPLPAPPPAAGAGGPPPPASSSTPGRGDAAAGALARLSAAFSAASDGGYLPSDGLPAVLAAAGLAAHLPPRRGCCATLRTRALCWEDLEARAAPVVAAAAAAAAGGGAAAGGAGGDGGPGLSGRQAAAVQLDMARELQRQFDADAGDGGPGRPSSGSLEVLPDLVGDVRAPPVVGGRGAPAA
jgi:hypothetical protein